MSESMPKSCRTDTLMSGAPGTASAWAAVCICDIANFINPSLPRASRGRLAPDLSELAAEAKARGGPHYSGRLRMASDQLVRSGIIIGLDDFPQFFFRRPVGAIGVGMGLFNQFLVAGLDGLFGGAGV